MISSFAGLEMSRRALNAFQLGIQTAGHNAANVSTPGYSRQRVNLSTTIPLSNVPGQIGTGVKADDIIRIRDEFLDFQYRSEMSMLGYWNKINHMYNTVQLYIAEPAGDGVRAAFDSFWSTLQELQKNPESSAIRRSVVESARTLGGMVDSIIKGYDQYASMVNTEIKAAVDEMNSILYDIAAMNKQIYSVQAAGQNANDLLDKRDLLLDKLSQMIDIDIQEPYKSGDITGEFFLTLNGRTLIQGDKVRELVAHAFYWENQVYYDVQVRDNEFDIVENTNVALALAVGPEGVHQLNVYRLANGESWTVGGDNPYCLNSNGSLLTILTSQTFSGGIVLNSTSSDATFTVSSGGIDVVFTLTQIASEWQMTAQVTDGTDTWDADIPVSSGSDELTVQELTEYMKNVFDGEASLFTIAPVSHPFPLPISATVSGNSFTLTSNVDSVFVEDIAGVLGMTTRYVPMRVPAATTTEALGLSTSFRIQVGTQGTQVTSKLFTNTANPDLAPGDIIGSGQPGDKYTFRVGANDFQIDVTAEWAETGTPGVWGWKITSDIGGEEWSTTEHLSIKDLTDFLATLPPSWGNRFSVNVEAGAHPTQFSIASRDNYLISISDVMGDLAARMGMVNPNPVITIDVNENDSLETIRNKINEKYQEEYGLTQPEQWVHASLVQAADQTWYLSIASNVPGEAQRITLMGDEDGNMQALRRLGLVGLELLPKANPGDPDIYREVTAYTSIAEDACFTFDGVCYLSADNKFDKARRVPSGTNRNDYTASKLETVSEGLFLELKGVGRTAITVRHHVKGGSVKALEEIRDALIPQLKAELDEIAWSLVNSFNAYQYSGYGIGDNINTTGVQFFNKLNFKSGSASLISVYSLVANDVSLIGAGMGMLDENGKASYGVSAGSGSGTNAARIASIQTSKLLNNGTASLGDFYEAYLAQIGSEAGRAALMLRAQLNLTDQIDIQRQSVMGVNIDEEMLDILKFNHAFNAMSRYANTIDEMLDRIINGFGVVGR